jgi:RNA polymerase sigma factor (sigma-70 family)
MLIPWFQREVSIDELALEGNTNVLQASMVDPAAETQEQKICRNELIDLVRKALGRLSAREQHIIRNRFGIQGGHERTLEEIADGLNLSRERVRQLERVAKNKLRRFLAACSPGPLIAEG